MKKGAGRLLSALLLVWLIVSLVFLLLHLAPGNPSDRFEDPRIPAQHRADLAERYGFDRPLVEQYGRFLASTLRGELGYSHQFARPVRQVLRQRLPNSLLLGGSALVTATAVGLLLGLLGSHARGPIASNILRLFEATAYALPTFWVALMSIFLFSYMLRWFPSTGLASATATQLDPLSRGIDLLHHMVLPTAVLAAPLAVQIARFLRASLVESLEDAFVIAARARGISESRLLLSHALRPSLGPVVQLLGVAVPAMLAGTFIVEVVFAWPGLGTALVTGIQGRDYSLVLAIATLSAVLVITGGALADLAQNRLDPRRSA